MKFATYKDGSRDGQLVVVSRDLATAVYPTSVASRLQQVLDDWSFLAPELQDVSDSLNAGRSLRAFPFDAAMCMAPLPRAYQWANGCAYMNHVELLHQAQGTEVPQGFYAEPVLHQGASDNLAGAQDPIVCASVDDGIDFSPEIAVITGDLPMGCSPERALEGVRLVLLANSVSLRNRIAADRATGHGLVQGKPVTAFSPVAVTPDELGDTWRRGRVHLTLQSTWNGRKVGLCEAGPAMTFHFGQLIAHLAGTRPLRSGTIIGSGTVSNPGTGKKGRQEWPNGYSCIAEKRAMEAILDGRPTTDYMQFGDTIRIEMKGRDGHSMFGAIDQTVLASPR